MYRGEWIVKESINEGEIYKTCIPQSESIIEGKVIIGNKSIIEEDGYKLELGKIQSVH